MTEDKGDVVIEDVFPVGVENGMLFVITKIILGPGCLRTGNVA